MTLQKYWSQIMSLITELSHEPYIDDQIEIAEIWNITEEYIQQGCFEREPWELKEYILKDIFENDCYDEYGVADPMTDLANAICISRDEKLKQAEIMMNAGRGYYGSDAAKLYLELGEDEKFVAYYENRLGKEEKPYEILIDYYRDRNHEKAVAIANLAIQNCKYDQTGFFIFLLQDARDRNDDETFNKLMKSVQRRTSKVKPFLVYKQFPDQQS